MWEAYGERGDRRSEVVEFDTPGVPTSVAHRSFRVLTHGIEPVSTNQESTSGALRLLVTSATMLGGPPVFRGRLLDPDAFPGSETRPRWRARSPARGPRLPDARVRAGTARSPGAPARTCARPLVGGFRRFRLLSSRRCCGSAFGSAVDARGAGVHVHPRRARRSRGPCVGGPAAPRSDPPRPRRARITARFTTLERMSSRSVGLPA